MHAKNSQLAVRLETSQNRLLKEVARARGETVATFVRRSILLELAHAGRLPEEQVRALNIERVAA